MYKNELYVYQIRYHIFYIYFPGLILKRLTTTEITHMVVMAYSVCQQ